MPIAAAVEKPECGASIAAKKAMGFQLEGASDDEGEDSASDGPASPIYSASDDEGDDSEEGEEGEDAVSDSGGSGYGFGCS